MCRSLSRCRIVRCRALALEHAGVLVVQGLQIVTPEQSNRARDAAHGLRDVVEALADLHALRVLVALHGAEEGVPARAVAIAPVRQHLEGDGVAAADGEQRSRDSRGAQPRVVVQQQHERRPDPVDREVDRRGLALRFLEPVHRAAEPAGHLRGSIGAAIVHDVDPLGRDELHQLADRLRQHRGTVPAGDDRAHQRSVLLEAPRLGTTEQLDHELDEVHERAEQHHEQQVSRPAAGGRSAVERRDEARNQKRPEVHRPCLPERRACLTVPEALPTLPRDPTSVPRRRHA